MPSTNAILGCRLRATMQLTLEVVEGPDAGKTARVAGTLEIGRDPGAGLALRDDQASRRHARISVQSGAIVLEDLESSNGTFVNNNELTGPTRIGAGDELLVGVSVIQVRSAEQIAIQASAVRAIPPGLAVAERRPTFTEPADDKQAAPGKKAPVVPELDKLLDARTKAQAQLAPFALLILVVLVVAIYLGTQSA
jgi:pSer/pThr/pTyr-binding forkhead associated (FHA) protein